MTDKHLYQTAAYLSNEGRVYINGKPCPPHPKEPLRRVCLTQIDHRIFLNGFELDVKTSTWKRTISALWHYFF